MRILNRIITLTDKSILYEADPRHAELLVRNMSVTNSVATPGVKDGDLENQAPKDHEEARCQKAMEGKVLEPVATEMAAVSSQQYVAEQVSKIYHTTLTNRHTQHRAQHYPIGPRLDKLSVAYSDALVTGTDATDLSDSDAAELNDIDSYLSTATQMGACTESDTRRIIYADDEPDDTYVCGSRRNKQVR